MKRTAEDDDTDSDEELFAYGNRMKLTFSKFAPAKKSKIADSDSDSDSSEESCESEDEEEVVDNDSEVEGKTSTSKNGENVVDSSLNNSLEDFLSPSPPPPPQLYVNGGQNRTSCAASEALKRLQQVAALTPSTPQTTSDTVSLIEDVQLNIKVRLHGVIQKFLVASTDPLRKLFKDIALKENVSEDQITLNWKNIAIQPTDTVDSLKITIADILECVLVSADDNDNIDKISLKVQGEGKNRKHRYMLKTSQPLEHILKDFCFNNGADVERSKFLFDGEVIKVTDTPADLDMEDSDIIDVILFHS